MTKKKKTYALAKLGSAVLTQDAEVEFIAEIGENDVKTALFDVLRVKRIRIMSTVQLTRLRNQGYQAPMVPHQTAQERHLQPVESIAGGRDGMLTSPAW